MAETHEVRLALTTDPSAVIRTARIIAKHLTALADELEAPDAVITFPGDITAEQAKELRERFEALYRKPSAP